MSELLGGLDRARREEHLGLSQFFIGAVVVAIVGNAAEHWVAVTVALKNKMDLACEHRRRVRPPRWRCSSRPCW